MEIYPQKWVDKYLKERTEDAIKDSLYHLVTHPDNQNNRSQIQTWVDQLPPGAQSKIIPNLQNVETLIETYNELIIGDILRRQGYTIEYEKKIDNLTPDWYVHGDSNNPPFLVEVFSYRISGHLKLFKKRVSDLRQRLMQIPIGVGLYIESTPNPLDALQINFSPARNKVLAKELLDWLNEKLSPNASKDFNDVRVEIVTWNSNFSGINLSGPAFVNWVGDGTLWDKIEAKVNKYSNIVKANNLPLIVAFISDFETSVGFEELENVTLGQPTIEIINGRQVETRKPDGLFIAKPELSGASYAYNEAGVWELKTVLNPAATFPASLPEII